MNSAERRAAIETHIATNWPSSEVLKVFDNIPVTEELLRKVEETSGMYAECHIAEGGETQQSSGAVGTRLSKGTGVLYVNVFVRKGEGTAAVRTFADQVADILRYVNLGGSALRLRVPAVSDIGEENGWYGIQVRTPFVWFGYY